MVPASFATFFMADPITTETQICNLALDILGSSAIGDINSADSEDARRCKRWFGQCRDRVLKQGYWEFAMKRATLTLDAAAPSFEYDYSFTVPADYLRIRRVHAYPKAKPSNDYRIEAGHLLIDTETAEILYVFRQETVSEYTPEFISALTLLLASELARKAAGSHELRERLMADYNAVLSEAATIDAQDERTEDRGIEGAIADSRLVMRRRTSELG